jgi:hypothetical protein
LVLDVSYDGGALFAVQTELWLNLPTLERLASLPVSMSVSLAHFRGRVRTDDDDDEDDDDHACLSSRHRLLV